MSGLHRTRPGADGMSPASAEHATEIARGIWMSPGLTNAYAVATDEGRIVINTGMGFEAPVHRQVFDEAVPGPTRFVVITQGHYDHVGGIGEFLDEGTDVVMNAQWRVWADDNERLLRFRANRSAFAFTGRLSEGIAHIRARFPDHPMTQHAPQPTLEITEPTTIEHGGRRLELIPVAGGETYDSLVVWLPEERIAFVSNTFGPIIGHIPNLVTIRGDRYREALTVVETIETVRALGAEMLVTGHFDPVVGADLIDSELATLRDAVQSVHDQTVAGMNAGSRVHELMRTVRLPDHLDVGEGYGQVKWDVRAIWETYAGWFHHSSTTELYGVPASAVRGDLVELAGGPEPIVAAARRHLDEGRPLEAIHLAEIAGEDPAALALLGDAHRALLDQTDNFWESAWLRHQVEELGNGRGAHL